jgi:hypothetical protein
VPCVVSTRGAVRGEGHMTQTEFDGLNRTQLSAVCQAIKEDPCRNALEADEARDCQRALELMKDSAMFRFPHPIRSGKTIGETRLESLRRRIRAIL